ncbi:18430_t:CDS:2 [Acaulospora morrowiae]|uniref:18430_t:CDS:1 n=1 Tax=Acaulospora morrowiae TaxID=94023 RepID=A0A9N8ZQD4_9GLOM|nr:18430_t:CDS:2 [Acaulospora morrowiae]
MKDLMVIGLRNKIIFLKVPCITFSKLYELNNDLNPNAFKKQQTIVILNLIKKNVRKGCVDINDFEQELVKAIR